VLQETRSAGPSLEVKRKRKLMTDDGGPPSTGGADIGHMGNVGGSIPGFSTLYKTASRTPEYAELGRQWKAGKNFNDAPVPWLAGSDQGSAVYGGGLPGAAADLGAVAAF
jgi:hypothetical protein